MKIRRIALPASVVLAALAARPAAAQACGPLTFAFSTTGPGCPTGGPGPIPTLSGALLLNPGNPTCPVRLLLNANTLVFPLPGTTVALGLSNPALPLPAIPGCTLWTSFEILLPMVPDPMGPNFMSVIVQVPPDPALLGATVFSQALLVLPGVAPRISNGLQIDIV